MVYHAKGRDLMEFVSEQHVLTSLPVEKMKPLIDIRSKNYERWTQKYVRKHAHGVRGHLLQLRPRAVCKFEIFPGITTIISSSSSYRWR